MAEWTSRDTRLRASVVIPYEDAVASVKEIELRAGDPNFAQVMFLSRTAEPMGQRRYWPIYRGRRRGGPADRRARVRLWRLADHQPAAGARTTSRRWSATPRRSRHC